MRIGICWLGLIFLSACAGRGPVIEMERSFPKEEMTIDETEPIGGEIPHEVNSQVNKWVNYFTGRGRPHLERYLARSTKYEKLMKGILREEGVPEDLFYIALIESGFSSSAVSHASAVGYWQFIRDTGRRYDLQINAIMDERRDPELATRAAARYLKSLHLLFNDWYLAAAAYNVGENRIKRLVMKYHTRDFWTLARRRKLPRETINYVPKYLAARMIAKRPSQYGFADLDYKDEIRFEVFTTDQDINLRKLAQNAGLDLDELKSMNPAFLTDYAPATSRRGGLSLRVPVGSLAQVAQVATDSRVTNTAHMQQLLRMRFGHYRVRRGDTLGHIARRHRTSVAQLRKINRLGKSSFLRVGQRLNVPLYSGRSMANYAAPTPSSQTKPSEASANLSPEMHLVRRGQSLSYIAAKYGVSLSSLLQANALKMNSILRVGQKLKIPSVDSKSSNNAAEDRPSGSKTYRVKRGDSLLAISQRTGVGFSQLLRLNQLQRRSKIYVGQVLKLQDKEETTIHRVRPGETLSHIAVKYGVPLRQIASANGITRHEPIRIGEKLVIPE